MLTGLSIKPIKLLTELSKNIYDDYPDLKIVFTGSSLLEILNARADLSRRAFMFSMQGLSYREYLNLVLDLELPIVSLEQILADHLTLTRQLNSRIKPLVEFEGYLRNGYYPFFQENPELYYLRLEEIVNLLFEVELPMLRNVEIGYVPRIKQLLQVIAQSVPFMPNISKLSNRIKINRNTLVGYLFYLQEAHLKLNLYRNAKGITRMQKPDKIYLENTNLIFTFSPDNNNKGNLRETFFINQVAYHHRVEYTENGDFLVDGKYIFEIGGMHKNRGQIKQSDEGYIVSDDLEYGTPGKIPLWLFGFLY